MAAYTLFGSAYEYEDCGIGSCWIYGKDECSYSLHAINGDEITFHRGDGKLLTLPRAEAETVMRPT